MEGQKIPKQSRTVDFTLSDGSRVRGDVFLHLFTFRHDSTQRLDELLNDDNTRFIPVKRVPEGSVTLLNLNHVVMVAADRREDSDELTELGDKRAVTVTAFGQEPIRGDIHINLPNEHGRVQDFFNQSLKFSALYQDHQVVYINHHHILSVTD